MKKNIVVPVDFSPTSINALDYALHIGSIFQLGIKVVHVHKADILVEAMPIGAPQYVHLQIPDHVRKNMAELRAEYVQKYSDIDFIIVEGMLHEVLENAGEKFDAQYIIMGTEGEQDLIDRLFGTNASTVVSKHRLPVFVVPGKFDARYKDFKKSDMVFASDIERINDWQILDSLIHYVKTSDLTLQVLTVRDPLPDKELKQFEKEKHDLLSEKLNGLKVEWHHAYRKNVEGAILDFAKNKKAQAIVVIAHDRDWISALFHSSVSESIVKKSGIPVWVLPDVVLEENYAVSGSGTGYF